MPPSELRPLGPASPTRRASPSARLGLIVYVALLVYASLYPLSGWRDAGLAPWAYLTAPWPRYLTRFDIVANVLGYVPLGALGVLAAYPRLRGVAAVGLVTLGGTALSGLLEATQTYLPNRVASNVDLGLNALSTAIGALAAAPLTTALIERSRLRDLRQRWFEPDASGTLIVIGLWLAALLIPQPMLFGLGEIVAPLRAVSNALFGDAVAWPSAYAFTPQESVVAEAAVAGCGLAGAALLMLQATRAHAPRMRLAIALALAAVAACSLASGVVLKAADALRWASPGAQLGLAIGVAISLAAAWAPRSVRLGFAIALLTVSAIVVNVAPDDPYFAATMADWHSLHWTNLAGLLHALGVAWPFVALAWLVRRARRTPPI